VLTGRLRASCANDVEVVEGRALGPAGSLAASRAIVALPPRLVGPATKPTVAPRLDGRGGIDGPTAIVSRRGGGGGTAVVEGATSSPAPADSIAAISAWNFANSSMISSDMARVYTCYSTWHGAH
jgi:hypothetical protein